MICIGEHLGCSPINYGTRGGKKQSHAGNIQRNTFFISVPQYIVYSFPFTGKRVFALAKRKKEAYNVFCISVTMPFWAAEEMREVSDVFQTVSGLAQALGFYFAGYAVPAAGLCLGVYDPSRIACSVL